MNLPGENPPPSDNLYVKGLPGMEGEMNRNSGDDDDDDDDDVDGDGDNDNHYFHCHQLFVLCYSILILHWFQVLIGYLPEDYGHDLSWYLLSAALP